MPRKRRRSKRNKGQFKRGYDPRRHVFTAEERQRAGQTTWQRLMSDRPELLRWFQRKIDKTAAPATIDAYRQRRHSG